MTIERDSIVWIVGWGDVLIRYDGFNWKLWNTNNSPLHNDEINFIKIDNHGVRWIGIDYGS